MLDSAAFETGIIEDGAIGAWSFDGAATEFVVSQWIQATQKYDSYVVTTSFPGMAVHNLVVDTDFAWGYWIWTDAPGAITFDVDF